MHPRGQTNNHVILELEYNLQTNRCFGIFIQFNCTQFGKVCNKGTIL